MSRLPPSTREPGRRGKQGETRARLIEVTIDLIRAEGLGALTTGRIANAAGIAQPGFYAHFRNVEDCLRTAISKVTDELRARVIEIRQKAFERFSDPETAGNLQAIRDSYAESYEVLLSEPTFAELLLRYRRDPALLDGYMGDVFDSIRDDLTSDIWMAAEAGGFKEQHKALVQIWGEQTLALFMWGAEAMLDGRHDDREFVLDALAQSSFAIQNAYARWMDVPVQLAGEAPARDDD